VSKSKTLQVHIHPVTTLSAEAATANDGTYGQTFAASIRWEGHCTPSTFRFGRTRDEAEDAGRAEAKLLQASEIVVEHSDVLLYLGPTFC